MKVFETTSIGKCTVKNRIIRAATFEGMCDKDGIPTEDYLKHYETLASNGVGAIITGFSYVSKDGMAMQQGQAGIENPNNINNFKLITDAVHKYDSKIFIQLAHTGRQTREKETGQTVYGVSGKKSIYFGEKPKILSTNEIYNIIEKFALAALNAKLSGFDGVQIHAAHGYLVHQFLLSSINNRKDEFSIDKKTNLGTHFLDLIIDEIREKCGDDFTILIKVSAGIDYIKPFTKIQFISLIKFLNNKNIDGIEISYGTMDYALNIFRGDIPIDTILKFNPIYKVNNKILKILWKEFILPFLKYKIKPYVKMYNLEYARLAKQFTNIPIICTGGFRDGYDINSVIENGDIDFVSICRPLLCETDFVQKLENNKNYISKCTNCNICVVMCDSNNKTKCYNA